MSNTTSGSISFLGAGSGNDFTSMIEALKEIEAVRLDSLQDSRDVATEKYDAYTELIETVREAKDALSHLNSPDEFLIKLASSSNENMVSAKATSDAVDSTHTIDITQLASNGIWAYKGTYPSATTSINTTGASQEFSYTYEGFTRTLNIAPGTTLEGLMNIVNQDKSNPGVKMHIMETADGHTFQISGTDSGKDATLTIHPSNLSGMSASGSVWESNLAMPLDQALNHGTVVNNYTYDFTMATGGPFSISLPGDATQQELVDAINAARPATPPIAEITSENKLTIDGVERIQTTITDDAGNVVQRGDSAITPTIKATIAADTSQTFAADATYSFTAADGTATSISVTAGETMESFLTRLSDLGYPVSGETVGDTMNLTISGIRDVGTLPINDVQPTDWAFSASATATASIQSDAVPRNMTFTLNMGDGRAPIDVDISSTDTLQGVIDAINAAAGAGTASYDTTTQKLVLNDVYSVTGIPGTVNLSGQVTSSDAWAIQEAQDAEFYIDNWPQLLTSSSNEVTNMLPGVTLMLKDVGEAQVSVVSDTDSVKANIQLVLDAINSVLQKVQDLTAVTDAPESLYSEDSVSSGLQGSVLTGNYGVQLFNSRYKNEIIGSPPGFQTQTSAEDIFSGDFVATLAQMGIKVSSDESDPNFGLFTIAPSGSTDEIQALDQALFDSAISDNLDDVIAFFASDDVGSSSSPDFRYSNHIEGLTKAGTYDVKYTIAADGTTEVWINGVKASGSDLVPNTYTLGSDGGDAQGISITLDNLTPGEYTGSVSIQQGKVRQLEDFFTAELKYFPPSNSDPSIGENNGGLMIMQDSYKEMIESLDKQIEEEIDRLARWEETERLKFARLDTLLSQYNNNMETLTQQMGQLE